MIIDVRPGVVGIPTTAYEAVDEVESEGKEISRVFKHISCAIEADESEEVIKFPQLVVSVGGAVIDEFTNRNRRSESNICCAI